MSLTEQLNAAALKYGRLVLDVNKRGLTGMEGFSSNMDARDKASIELRALCVEAAKEADSPKVDVTFASLAETAKPGEPLTVCHCSRDGEVCSARGKGCPRDQIPDPGHCNLPWHPYGEN